MRKPIAALVVSLAFLSGTATAEAAKTLGPQFLGGPGAKRKPAKIGVGAKGQFERLRWRGWGKTNAYARGVYDVAGFRGDPSTGYRGAVGMRAFGRKRCANGNFVYTRVRYRLRKPLGGKRVFRERFSVCR